MRSTEEAVYSSGISLVSAKNDTLLSYLVNLALLSAARLQGLGLPEDVVRQLVKERVVLEKMKPLEAKLRYQVEKLLRKAESAEQGQQQDELGKLLTLRLVSLFLAEASLFYRSIGI